MNEKDLAAALAEELHRIAPDIELAEIDREADLREQFDLDSMDFLNLVTALHKRYGIPIPQCDYPRLASSPGRLRIRWRRSIGATKHRNQGGVFPTAFPPGRASIGRAPLWGVAATPASQQAATHRPALRRRDGDSDRHALLVAPLQQGVGDIDRPHSHKGGQVFHRRR